MEEVDQEEEDQEKGRVTMKVTIDESVWRLERTRLLSDYSELLLTMKNFDEASK